MELLEQLQAWHDAGEYERIIETLEAMPAEDRGYRLTGLLARAYQNAANGDERPAYHERSLELLQSEVDETDPDWNFRVGFALYWLDQYDKAIPYFERIFTLIADDAETQAFWADAAEMLEQCRQWTSPVYLELYEEAEMEALEQHIHDYFGEIDTVMHEIASPDIHVDIYVVKPTPERNYYTLITGGMGAHRMQVPEELQEYKLERAEMMICLPPDWRLESGDEADYWPIRWLKILARLPIMENSWLGWGHTIANPGEVPFADNTGFSGVILLSPGGFPPEASVCVMPDGSEVNFYAMMPLYREEMDYKCQNNADALLELLQQEVAPEDLTPLNLQRKNVCAARKKQFRLSAADMRDFALDIMPGGCIATDRITVDGCKVGYCYRQTPDEGCETWDSGWRFVAGDEGDDYMNNAENSGIYDLNTICNYDADIVPLLDASYGSAFVRDEAGLFQPVTFYSDEDA